MSGMRDKLLTYALVASIGVHVVILGLVGKTSAAKPIEVEQLKIVRVDLVKVPDEVAVQTDKPEHPEPKVESSPPEAPYVPPPHKMVSDPKPPKPADNIKKQPKRQPDKIPANTSAVPPSDSRPVRPVNDLPGDPGGALTGMTTPNGQDLGQVPTGNTGVGWVPGPDTGKGSGSGTGAGKGTPEPDPGARLGPGLTSGSGNVAPPPPPKMVTVTVCSASGVLPGQYCEKTEKKSFREGQSPSQRCNECKAPHISRLADRADPVLVKDCKPTIPDIDEAGDFTVEIRYTVNKDGSVSNIEIMQSSKIKAIDKAITSAAAKMRYEPAIQDGQPRSVTIRRKYKIRI